MNETFIIIPAGRCHLATDSPEKFIALRIGYTQRMQKQQSGSYHMNKLCLIG